MKYNGNTRRKRYYIRELSDCYSNYDIEMNHRNRIGAEHAEDNDDDSTKHYHTKQQQQIRYEEQH